MAGGTVRFSDEGEGLLRLSLWQPALRQMRSRCGVLGRYRKVGATRR